MSYRTKIEDTYSIPQAYVHVKDFAGNRTKALINADQANANIWQTKRDFIDVSITSPTWLNNGSGYLEARIPKGSYPNLRHIALRIAVDIATSATVIAPAFKWFKRIVILQGNRELYNIYGLILEYLLLLSHSSTQQKSLARLTGGNEVDILAQPNAKGVGSHQFDLPIMASFLRNLDIDWSSSVEDLIIRCYPEGNIAYAANSSNCTNTSLKIVIDSSDLNARNAYVGSTLVNVPKSIDSNNFCNWVMIENQNQTITCGAVNNIDLTQLQGLVPFLMFAIRPASYSNASGSNTYYNLGDKTLSSAVGLLDIVDVNNNFVIGNGSSLQSNYVRGEMMHQSDSPVVYKKPIYVPQFGNSVSRSLNGKIDGFYKFNGEKNQLQFTPQQSVQEVHTLTGTALAAGHIRIKWRGDISPSIANNASTATLASTFAALPQAQSSNTTCAFSATFAAGASVVATFTTPEMSVNGDLIEIITSEATPWTTAVTTYGFAGLPASGSYCTQIFAPVFNRCIYQKGKALAYPLDIADL